MTHDIAWAYDPSNQRLHLHYNQPATEWSQALPVGNGRLGAMVYGRTGTELLQLNEDSVWYGGRQNRTPPNAARHLPELRRRIRAGEHAAAEKLARRAFFSNPLTMRLYEPLGQVNIEFGHGEVVGYKRWLDLGTATQSTVYRYTNDAGRQVSVRRDVVVSYPAQVVLVRVKASEAIEYDVRLTRGSAVEFETDEFFDSVASDNSKIVLHATPGGKGSNPLCMVLGASVDAGGSVEAVGGALVVTARECILAIGAHTTYRHSDPEAAASTDVDVALRQPWEDLIQQHITNYTSLFGRANVELSPDMSHVPTDERLAVADARADPGLASLYHNYGRYLLLSSSRPGPKALPANLQGIWNPSFTPPWGSKFTININLQMNYWPAAMSNLAECALTLVDLLERMAERGKHTAQSVYGSKGWCAHSYTDIWADTDPHDAWMPATLWPLGGLWVVSDAVEMLKYHFDRAVLSRLAPVLEGAVEFVLNLLVPSADGKYLVTSPSLSPENAYVDANGARGIFCEGSAMDITLIRRALELYLWTARTLGTGSTTLISQARATLPRLPPLTISPSTGLIQEWGLTDYAEHEPGHRHVSHLVGLYPLRYIDSSTPTLQDAAKRVLERRAAHGGGHTGWSRAWLINLHARLTEGEAAVGHVDALLNKSTMPNMLDNHPPFQIDGNFGGAAGVIECLVQSHFEDEQETTVVIDLLPACPRSWADGKVHGLCVLGGWSVAFSWKEGKIRRPVRLTCREDGLAKAAVLAFPDGQSVRVTETGDHAVTIGELESTRNVL